MYFENMQHPESGTRLPNYLRIHRRKSGLSQDELGKLLGHTGPGGVAKHEQHRRMPPLVVAIGYECIFRIPVSELFAGLRDEIFEDVERRIADLEQRLGESTATGRAEMAIARKLTWIYERTHPEDGSAQ